MKYLLLIFFFILSGCATWFPAAVKKMDDGSYNLSTTGNSFASTEKMKKKLEKKAKSICGEPGFEYSKEPSIDWGKQKDYSTGITASYKVMSANIKCKLKS